MSNDNANQELLQIFIEEAIDLVDALSTTIQAWEKDLQDLSKIADLKRDLHTLKGSARMVGQKAIGTLTHEIETLCEALEKGQVPISKEIFALVNLGQDRIAAMLEALKNNQSVGDINDILTKFHQHLPKTSSEKSTPPPPPPMPKGAELPPSENVKTETAETKHTSAPEVIRVSSDILETLNSLTIENSILRSNIEEQILNYNAYIQEMKINALRLEDHLETLNVEIESSTNQMRRDTEEQIFVSVKETATDLSEGLKSLIKVQATTESLMINYTRISTSLQYNLSGTRLVPFESIVPRLNRMVRQISSELHKEVDFKVTETEGEMDRKVLEHLVPSLEHILRNAIDHGIESSEVRRKLKKPERGTIEVSFTRKGSIVSIEIKDDGAGIDSNAIRKKAIKLGLLAEDAKITEEEAILYIMEPGFSTRETVSEISGRGVGMDVVNMAVKEMGGSLNILSEKGLGTRMIVRFPFTISLNRILLFSLQGQVNGMLLSNIESVVHIEASQLASTTFTHNDKKYDLYYLGSLLESEREVIAVGRKKIFPAILLSLSEHPVALVVDEILYNRELVVQAIAGQLKLTNLFSGATLLGDGTAVFILDPYYLTQKAKSMVQKTRYPIHLSQYKIKEKYKQQTVLIVDDSVSARTVIKNLLERHHYQVITAKDGADALQVLESHLPDLIILDIDMPRMDGFEFSADMRQDARYKDIPIVIVTARPKEHQKRAAELKLYNIIDKPFQKTKFMSTIWSVLGKKS